MILHSKFLHIVLLRKMALLPKSLLSINTLIVCMGFILSPFISRRERFVTIISYLIYLFKRLNTVWTNQKPCHLCCTAVTYRTLRNDGTFTIDGPPFSWRSSSDRETKRESSVCPSVLCVTGTTRWSLNPK